MEENKLNKLSLSPLQIHTHKQSTFLLCNDIEMQNDDGEPEEEEEE